MGNTTQISMEKARKLNKANVKDFVVEAKEYFRKTRNESAFALNRFEYNAEIKGIVDELYKAGASGVFVSGLYTEKVRIKEELDIYADTLIVYAPKLNEKLISLFIHLRPDSFFEISEGVYHFWWD